MGFPQRVQSDSFTRKIQLKHKLLLNGNKPQRKTSSYYFWLPIKPGCPECDIVNTHTEREKHLDYLINKFVWHPGPRLWRFWARPVVTGCSSLTSTTAQAAFCAVGWRPHWWPSWPRAGTSDRPASGTTGSCNTTPKSQQGGIKTAASHIKRFWMMNMRGWENWWFCLVQRQRRADGKRLSRGVH